MKFVSSFCWLFLILALLGCSSVTSLTDAPTSEIPPTASPIPPTPTPLPLEIDPIVGRADVLITAEEVTAIIGGNLPGDCWALDEPELSRVGSNISIVFSATRPEDEPCTLGDRPYELRVPLDPEQLSNSFYGLTVNGQASASFTYDAQKLASAGGLLEISGRVWHDVCAYRTSEQVTQPPTGCTATDEAGYLANGTPEDAELGIAQLVVQIGIGQCPAAPLLTAVTDQDGRYSFPEVSAAVYCVMILSESGSNELLLAPGTWTSPPAVRGETNAYMSIGEPAANLDFGWDYSLLPLSATQRACDDKALFIEHVNHPPDDRVQAGQELLKTWRVQNVGTCSWSDSYRLVWVDGNVRVNAEEPLGETIVPGEVAEISVGVTIPQGSGRFRGSWLIQNGQGERFGMGINGNTPLSLNVVVPAPPATATPAVVPTPEG